MTVIRISEENARQLKRRGETYDKAITRLLKPQEAQIDYKRIEQIVESVIMKFSG